MTRPQVASRSEVARGLRASVCAATPGRGVLPYKTRNVALVQSIVAASLACGCAWGLPVSFSATSPSGRNEIRLDTEPALSYSVFADGVERFSKAQMFLRVNGRGDLGAPCRAVAVKKKSLSGRLETPIYKKASIDLAANETFVEFEGGWGVRLIARDDGVAYRFETQFGEGNVKVLGERMVLTFAPSCKSVLSTVAYNEVYKGDPFQHSGEGIPVRTAPDAVFAPSGRKGKNVYSPIVAEYSDGVVVAVTESDQRDFPTMEFVRDPALPRSLRSSHQRVPSETTTSDWHENPGAIVRRAVKYHPWIAETAATRTYPWRAFAIAPRIAKLPENDLVHAIAAPCALKDVSWIKPGKMPADWWNGFNIIGVDFRAGCNDRSYKYLIDFAGDFGLEYVVLDLGWSEGVDPMKPVVDVPHLVEYAAKRGVGVLIWTPLCQLQGRLREVFAHYAKMGVKGVKVDGMDGNDQLLERFAEEMAKVGAEYRLVLCYHGYHRPAGIYRTYPNVLTCEGVYGQENLKWRVYDSAQNAVYNTYVRMTAGPLDYTPGGFRNCTAREFHPYSSRPSVNSTRVHGMALVPHYENPLLRPCDSPSLYRKESECFSFMAKVPSTWDETVGVAGDGERFSAIARRKGGVWYLSVIGNAKGGKYEIPLDFLNGGEWDAEVFADGVNVDRDATDYSHRREVFKAGGRLVVSLAPSGGYVARIERRRVSAAAARGRGAVGTAVRIHRICVN